MPDALVPTETSLTSSAALLLCCPGASGLWVLPKDPQRDSWQRSQGSRARAARGQWASKCNWSTGPKVSKTSPKRVPRASPKKAETESKKSETSWQIVQVWLVFGSVLDVFACAKGGLEIPAACGLKYTPPPLLKARNGGGGGQGGYIYIYIYISPWTPPLSTPPLQRATSENRSCTAIFRKLRCRSCTATLAFLQCGRHFSRKLRCDKRKTALQHRKSCVARKWHFPAAFLWISYAPFWRSFLFSFGATPSRPSPKPSSCKLPFLSTKQGRSEVTERGGLGEEIAWGGEKGGKSLALCYRAHRISNLPGLLRLRSPSQLGIPTWIFGGPATGANRPPSHTRVFAPPVMSKSCLTLAVVSIRNLASREGTVCSLILP